MTKFEDIVNKMVEYEDKLEFVFLEGKLIPKSLNRFVEYISACITQDAAYSFVLLTLCSKFLHDNQHL